MEYGFEVVVYSDSDWAGDAETRKSISGYVIFLMGCPIFWKSRQQNVVGLSSSEAELYACIDAVKEVKFIIQILMSMNIQVKLPVIVRVDNTGAIFMSENLSASQHTKHVDLRARYLLNQLIEEKWVKLVFVPTEKNLSDAMTKNVTREVYEKVSGAYVALREYWESPSDRKGVGVSSVTLPDDGRTVGSNVRCDIKTLMPESYADVGLEERAETAQRGEYESVSQEVNPAQTSEHGSEWITVTRKKRSKK